MEHAQRDYMDKTFNIDTLISLNPYFNGTCSKSNTSNNTFLSFCACLNPYFNGTCSKSVATNDKCETDNAVLILILMEHAQREHFL